MGKVTDFAATPHTHLPKLYFIIPQVLRESRFKLRIWRRDRNEAMAVLGLNDKGKGGHNHC